MVKSRRSSARSSRGRHVALGGAGPVAQLLGGDLADLDQQRVPGFALRDVEVARLGADHLLPLAARLVDPGEGNEGFRVAGIRVARLLEGPDGALEIAGPAQGFPVSVEGLRVRAQLLAEAREQITVELDRSQRRPVLEGDLRHTLERGGVVRRNPEQGLHRRDGLLRGPGPAEGIDVADQDAGRALLGEGVGAVRDDLVVAASFDGVVGLEGKIAQDGACVDVGRVELERALRGLLGAEIILEALTTERGDFSGEAGSGGVALGPRELALEELDGRVDVAAGDVGCAEGHGGVEVRGDLIERSLVVLDRGVTIATSLEEPGSAEVLLRLALGAGRLVGERVDRVQRGVGVAEGFADAGQGLQGTAVLGVQRVGGLERGHRTLGRAELLGEDAAAGEVKLETPARVLDQAHVALVERGEILPAVEDAIVSRERGVGALVGAIDGEDRLPRLGGRGVVQELLVLDPGDALPEGDLLAWGGGDGDLSGEVGQELAVSTGLAEEPVEPAERVEVVRVHRRHGLEATDGLTIVLEAVLEDLGDAAHRPQPILPAFGVRAALEDLDQSLMVVRPLVDASEGLAGAGVTGILPEDPLVEVPCAPGVGELDFQDLGRLTAEIAGEPGARGRVRARGEDHPELRPLLRLAVDLREPAERRVVRGIGLEDGLVDGQGEVRALDAAEVPVGHARVQLVLGLLRQGVAQGRRHAGAEDVLPVLLLGARELLDLLGEFVARGVLAERLGEGDERLLSVLEFLDVEAADLRQGSGAVLPVCRAFAPLEQHLHELVVLPQAPAQGFQGGQGRTVAGERREHRRVGVLGGLWISTCLVHAGRLKQEASLGILCVGLLVRDLLGRQLERLGDAERVRPNVYGLLERPCALELRRLRQERIDAAVEVLRRDLRLVAGLDPRQLVKLAQQIRGVGRALRGVLGE